MADNARAYMVWASKYSVYYGAAYRMATRELYPDPVWQERLDWMAHQYAILRLKGEV